MAQEQAEQLETQPRSVKGAQWRQDNIGRLMGDALVIFEARLVELMAEAGFGGVMQSHIKATRHLDIDGTRLTEMAQRAVMTKQSMSELVAQLESLGLVSREPDPLDGRARIVKFTDKGRQWLKAFQRAVSRAEREMAAVVGTEPLEAIKASLKLYCASSSQGD